MTCRDSPPTSGLGYLQQLEAELVKIGVGKVASVAAASGPWTAITCWNA
jgi:bisphosphoglycerate-independent phosphoglycerate mutase (AlkP superfamily)